jgi:2-amino-4-hydroxy-6-hydroxymethyldihydropteridine diphosphokinase
MPDVYLILGGNLGDRIKNLQKATDYISRDIGEIVDRSSVYETEPWGFSHDSSFINQVLRIITALKPSQVLESVLNIEKLCGRRTSSKEYTARIMDIDILFYNNEIINSDRLIIPHPLIQERMFVLVPMAELQPYFIHPVLKRPISYLKDKCDDIRWVRKYRN